jgi:hypothetical protein
MRVRRALALLGIAGAALLLLVLSGSSSPRVRAARDGQQEQSNPTLPATHTDPAAFPREGAPVLPSVKEKQTNNTSIRMLLATIPRSGNGWLRGLIEAAIGVGTLSVFPEEGAVYNPTFQAYSE